MLSWYAGVNEIMVFENGYTIEYLLTSYGTYVCTLTNDSTQCYFLEREEYLRLYDAFASKIGALKEVKTDEEAEDLIDELFPEYSACADGGMHEVGILLEVLDKEKILDKWCTNFGSVFFVE